MAEAKHETGVERSSHLVDARAGGQRSLNVTGYSRSGP
jgi:hypothetical protein